MDVEQAKHRQHCSAQSWTKAVSRVLQIDPERVQVHVYGPQADRILELFARGLDTFAVAKAVGCSGFYATFVRMRHRLGITHMPLIMIDGREFAEAVYDFVRPERGRFGIIDDIHEMAKDIEHGPRQT